MKIIERKVDKIRLKILSIKQATFDYLNIVPILSLSMQRYDRFREFRSRMFEAEWPLFQNCLLLSYEILRHSNSKNHLP